MRRRWRWAVVVALTGACLVLPLAPHVLPAGDSDIGAAQLLRRITSSAAVPYSGYAQSTSSLALPVTGRPFAAVQSLFGSTSELRVWWRSAQDWRVDSIGVTGESDLHRQASGTWTWDYESDTARFTQLQAAAAVRLPRSDDLVPANLARRLLSEAPTSGAVRLPGQRVAGHETAGLRVHVLDARSTIDHIDVWALPASGLPVRVEVYGVGASRPLVSTSLLDLSLATPSGKTTRFVPSGSVRVRGGEFGDIVAAVDQFGTSRPPASLAGLPRRTDLDLGAVGVYGSGVTVLAAIPLSARLADYVLPGLANAPGLKQTAAGIAIKSGALNLQLTPPNGFGGARWLLVGTVTPKTLLAAVPQLPPAGDLRFRR